MEAAIVSELAALGLLAAPRHPKPRLPTFDDFAALKMLSAAVKEAMRLLPLSSAAFLFFQQTVY